jgi:hypothetical protein
MRQIAIAGLPALFVLFGCTHMKPTSPDSAPNQAGATVQSPKTSQGAGTTTNSTARPSGSSSQPADSTPAPAKPKGCAKKPPQPATAATGSSSQGGADSVKPKLPTSKDPQKTSATPAASASGAAQSTPAAPAAGTAARQSTPPAPTLDLASLEQRLKETRAIGMFSKLSLKNQVDDLLNEFRAFHQKRATASLPELRQKYDLLLLKVLSLLQDGDPPLATAISTSREAIWGILADPNKFAKI